MDLATASIAIKKATNTFKALKDVDAALDAALVLESYTKELEVGASRSKDQIAAAQTEIENLKGEIAKIQAGNEGLKAEGKAEKAIIISKAKADAEAIVTAANAKAEEIRQDIAANNRTLRSIHSEIAATEAALAEKRQSLEDLKKLIETTKAQFKAIGG